MFAWFVGSACFGHGRNGPMLLRAPQCMEFHDRIIGRHGRHAPISIRYF